MALTYEELLGVQKKRQERVEQATKQIAPKNATVRTSSGNTSSKPYAQRLIESDMAPYKVISRNVNSGFTAPITKAKPTVTTSTKKKKEDDRTWFKKSSYFDDGYDFGDITKTILGTVADVGEDISTGIIGMGEKALDSLMTLGTAMNKANTAQANFNMMSSPLALTKKGRELSSGLTAQSNAIQKGTEKYASQFVAKDLYDEEQIAKKIISAPIKSLTGMDVESASVFGEKTDALVQSGGQLLATAGLNAVGVPWFLTTGATSFGAEAEGAFREGATFEQGAMSAAISAGAEILTEKLSGGIKFKLPGQEAAKTLDDILLKPLTEKISNKVVKALANFGIDALGEGGEEFISGIFSNLGSALYKDKKIGEILWSEEAWDEYIESFIGGAVLGGVSSTAKAVADRNKIELDENEQKVYDKVVETLIEQKKQDGSKVDKKAEAEIRKEVLQSILEGSMDTDTIESILDGEEYETYKKVSDKGSAYKSKIEEAIKHYQDEYDTLGKMKRGEMTREQIEREAALKENLEQLKTELKEFESDTRISDLKTKISNNVYEMVKDSRLGESYREIARGGQAFKADLSKYDAKQQEVIKKAIESGVLNNKNSTHRFVDLVARLSAEKGISFDFANNEKIKESGFAVEGKTVNGYKADDGSIVVNVQSKKSLNSVVGHEITHVLEGTELYAELQEAIKAYATTKGEYAPRLQALRELYEGVYKGEDFDEKIRAELVADIVGDYLFTDYDFVRNLSANKNVFQKLWDEVKYLCKIATAGSQEAKELEKVKRNFERAFQESAKNTGKGVQHSLGYHAGDLGKSNADFYHNQGGDRGTGHFGTGVYFVGDESQINVGGYAKRPHHTVEFDNYNLYKVRNTEDGYKLHDALKAIDSGFSKEFMKAAINDDFKAFDVKSEAFKLSEEYQEEVYDEELGMMISKGYFDATIRAFTEVAEKYGIPIESFEKMKAKYDAEYYDEHDDFPTYYTKSDYYDYLNDTLEEAEEEMNKGYDKFRNAYFNLWLRFGKDNTDNALQKVIDHDLDVNPDGKRDWYREKSKMADSRATVFMKSLGYEGIDVRGTELDNTGYGSVIYDLKGEDVKKRDEIGTAKYSLSSEQEAYFKDSKVRDENGNLKVMYHGTSKGGFTVFDTYGSNYGLFGTGSYFTDNKSVAEFYTNKSNGDSKKVYETYLNITNPIDMDAEADVNAWAKALPEADFSNCTTNEDCYRAMEDYFEDEEYPQYEASEIAMDAVQSMGYDGITHIGGGRRTGTNDTSHRVYIAFEPEQIKNIDNIAPTSNPDIRYSLTEDSEGNKLTEKQSEYFANSKAVDGNGNLLKVYHTTKNDFTVFDKARKGEATEDANTYLGFFFSDDAEFMQNFPEFEGGKTESYYLDMKNPIDFTNMSEEAFLDIVEVMGGDVDEAAEVYHEARYNDSSLQLGHLLMDLTGEFSYNDFIKELKPNYDTLMSKGYDGVIGYLDEGYDVKEYIVLDSNQAKLTSNLNPTADADVRYSLSKDTEGRALSAKQRKYFADSKVKDANGNLKVMYHGSHESFTVFDKKKARSSGTYGKGFYFTDSKSHAGTYGDSYEVYLNITNPLKDGTNDITKEQLRKFVEVIAEDEDYGIENYGYGATIDSVTDSIYGKSDFGMLLDLNVSCIGNMVEAVELFNKVNGTNYDGIVAPTETVAFYPNQIKAVTNQNPTDNPDINLSLSEEGETPKEYGSYNVYGEDVAYQPTDVAPTAEAQPVAEDAATEQIAPIQPTVSEAEEAAPTSVQQDIAPTPISTEPLEEVPIRTMNQKLTAKLNQSQEELEKNIQLREKSNAYYDEKIAKAQADYNAKKNKDSKVANNLLRSIERYKRLKGSADADYEKRIYDIESRMTKLDDQLLSNHDKADRLERYKKRADAQLEVDKALLKEEFGQKKAKLLEEIASKPTFVRNKALELYNELNGLRKGVKASEELGILLDQNFKWSELKSTLLKVSRWSDTVLNPESEIETIVRDAIGRDYEDKLHYGVDDIDVEYEERLDQLEADAQKKLDEFKVANQRMTKQQEYRTQMEELVGDTSTWVDKKLGISYEVNTLRRNLRDIVRDANGKKDIAKADAIYDELQGKYNHHEAELNRESNRIKQKFADMKITKAEDTYIQMLGELRHNPETTLTEDVVKEFYEKHKKHIDEAKVDSIIEEARTLYDDLLVRVNQVLKEQGMKEIPRRQGYFPHFKEEKQGFLGKLFNWKTQNNDIPTDIAGLTETFEPSRSWQSFNKERKTDDTDYSFSKGLDSYVQGSLDWIYHIEDIQKRRALENHIRYTHSEEGIKEKVNVILDSEVYDADQMQEQIELVYREARNPLNNFIQDFHTATNTLAGKKSSFDRDLEQKTNRKIYSVMTNLSNRVSGNMVAGSVSSALTNFIPITQSWVEVSPVGSLRAMKDTIASTFRDDGTIDKSDFLTNRLKKAENLYQTNWDKVGKGVGFLMDVIDGFTSQTVWRSKYNQNISKGMSESEAIKNADIFSANVMADRSRGNQPTIFDSKSPVSKIFTAFQLEVNNQYGYFFKDAPQDIADKSKARLAAGYATAFIGAYAYNALYSTLTGRDAALDPIGIIEDLLKDLGFGGDDDEEEEIAPVDVAMNLTNNILEEMPFIGGLLGGGRIPISSAMPYGGIMEAYEGTLQDISEKNVKSLTKEWLNPIYYLALPMGGGQIRKTNQGLAMFSDEHPVAGSYTDSGNLRFPIDDTLKNRIQAGVFGQYASENARTYFDEGYAPLKEKQIQEYRESDMPIADYWKYREGLKDFKSQDDKVAYINGLDISKKQKDVLKSYLYDEEGYKKENPEKYAFLEREGIGFLGYKELDEDTQSAWSWAFKHQDEYEYYKQNGVLPGDYSTYYIPMLDFENEDNDAYSWAYDNPEKATFSKAIIDNVVDYRKITKELYAIRADKDENGNSISGTAKSKKQEYIWSLDIDEAQKYILFKNEYNSYDDHNQEIVDYIISRDDLSYDERKTILETIGFTIDEDGTIRD